MFETTSPKFRKQIFGLLANRWGFGSFGVLTFQQAIEASATLWLVLLMNSIISGAPFFHYLLIYLATLVFPYIPWCIAYVLKISWKQEALRSFIQAFVNSNRNNVTEWTSKSKKEEKLSILTAEAPNAINLLIDYIFDLYSYILSVFFNIIALSIVVEPLFAAAYFVSVLSVIVIMKLKRKMLAQLTKKALAARVDLTQSLLAAWDNVLLGNDYNFRLWQERTNQRVNRSLQKNVALERFDQVMAIVVSLMTSIPSLLVVIWSAWKHRGNVAELSSFVVTLPILFMILSYTYQTLSLAFRWGMHKSKLIALFKAIQPMSASEEYLEGKVKWNKIRLSRETSGSQDCSLAYTTPPLSPKQIVEAADAAGRLTLRGENGSGKSTLLMLIKNALKNKAYLLPTHSQLSFSSEAGVNSTGEILKQRLTEIIEKVDVNVLLLDEWDANLDAENRDQLSQMIDEIAKQKCVIEVRHR